MFTRYIGDRNFYRQVAAIGIPIIVQNVITNFVSMLDNIMVGQVGTLQMSGVSIVNTILFVFMICIYGVVSGAGIYTAQFAGSMDHDSIRHTFRFKIMACLITFAVGIGILIAADRELISLFLQGEGSPDEIAATLEYGRSYLHVMLWGLLPFAIASAYSSTLRETGKTTPPMIASLCAVATNLVLNYILIFGHFGVPAFGVRGAAIATVVSRYVELGIVAAWAHLNPRKNPFIVGAYRSLHVPAKLTKQVLKKGAPLMANELFWSLGTTFAAQCYSMCGLDAIAATNIANTVINLFTASIISMGNVTGIYLGQLMGAGTDANAIKDHFRKITALSIAICIGIALGLIGVSGVFPLFYNTTDTIRNIATTLIILSAVFMPCMAFCFCVYSSLRAGGQALKTVLFDTGFMWLFPLPLVFVLSRFTDLPVTWLYGIYSATEVIKCSVGFFLIRGTSWVKNLTTI